MVEPLCTASLKVLSKVASRVRHELVLKALGYYSLTICSRSLALLPPDISAC